MRTHVFTMEAVPRWWIFRRTVPGSGNVNTQKLKQIVKLIMYNCSHFLELSITILSTTWWAQVYKSTVRSGRGCQIQIRKTLPIWFMNNTTKQETDAYGYSIKTEEITVSASATTENINYLIFYVNRCYATNTKNPFCPNFCHWPKNWTAQILGGCSLPAPPSSYAHDYRPTV